MTNALAAPDRPRLVWLRRRRYALMLAALPATALVHPIDPVGVLPRGLTDTDAERIAAAIAAARTESSRHVYAGVRSRRERWCAGRGMPVLPSDPLAVCGYLTERAADGRAMGTLDLICTVIRHVHLGCDLQPHRRPRRPPGPPRPSPHLRLPSQAAGPATIGRGDRHIVGGIDRTTPIGLRDTAMILLGYASAVRRSELVALTLDDIEDKPPPA